MQAQVVVVSDRVLAGEKENAAGLSAVGRLREAGFSCDVAVVPERSDAVADALRRALDAGARVVLTLGGTGVGRRGVVPEVTERYLAAQFPALAFQILQAGLASTPKAGLTRGLVGVTARDGSGAVIINSASSRGAVSDALDVMLPLIPHIFRQLEE